MQTNYKKNNKLHIHEKVQQIVKKYFNDDIKEHCKINKYNIYLLCDKKSCECTTFECTKSCKTNFELNRQLGEWLDVTY